MEPIVEGELGWSFDENRYVVQNNDNYRITIPQSQITRTGLNILKSDTENCCIPPLKCRHMFHIPQRDTLNTYQGLQDICASLNYQTHVILGTFDYTNLVYHTLIGKAKRTESGEFRLSQKDISQIASQLGLVVSARVKVPSATEIAKQIHVPSAADIASEVGEISLNEVTKADLIKSIFERFPTSASAQEIGNRIHIPPVKVPSASEIASLIKVPTAQEISSAIKMPTAQEIASQIKIPKADPVQIDYARIASETAAQIQMPDGQKINIQELAAEIAKQIHIPQVNVEELAAEVASRIKIPPIKVPTAQQIASEVKVKVPTAQEIANNIKCPESKEGQLIKEMKEKVDLILLFLGGDPQAAARPDGTNGRDSNGDDP